MGRLGFRYCKLTQQAVESGMREPCRFFVAWVEKSSRGLLGNDDVRECLAATIHHHYMTIGFLGLCASVVIDHGRNT